MRIKLHLDTIHGESVIRPCYEINFDGLSQIAGFNDRYSGTLGDGSKYDYFYVSNSVGLIDSNVSGNIPRTMDDNNNTCLFPYRLRYDSVLGGVNYPHTWFDTGAFEQLETQPDDWNEISSCKYLIYTDMPNSPAYKGFAAAIPGVSTFVANNTYIDNNRTYIRRYVAENGAYFVCSQMCVYGGYAAGGPYYHPFTICVGESQGNDTVFHYHTRLNETVTGDISFRNSNAKNTENPPWSSGYNHVYVFVHYIKNSDDYYGVAKIIYSSFDDTAIITKIECTGFTVQFWGNSIISGGESGVGEWGNPTIPNVNDGTFSSTSNSVGTDNPNYSTTAIQTRVNTALGGLFSGLTGVYSIYLLDTADGQSISFTELTRIYNVLYASGNDKFLTRYLQSMYNPLSAVIAMHLIPYQFTASALFGATVRKQLTISGYNVSMAISETTPPEYNILKPLGRVVFPRLDMPKYFGGFADFAPYTQCILHLPFIGAVELKTNAIAHGAITVEYLCDMISGNVTARISCTDNTGENTQYVHTASGNCAYNLPLFTMNQNGDAVGKLLSGGAGIVSGALTGNPVNVATGVAGVVGAAIESSFSPRSTQISGNMGGNNMIMSNLDIWLEIVRPVWVENMYYQKLNGIPANMSNCIADCGQDASAGVAYDGFLQIETIDLDNVPCTEQEKQEIETLLKQGVFIRGSEI